MDVVGSTVAGTVVASGGLAVLAAALLATARAIAADRLPHNGVVGIRIPATYRSQAAWRAGHRAALPWLRAASAVAAAALVAAVLVASAGSPGAGLVVALTGYGLVVAVLLAATLVAARAAPHAP
ncbi:SdpI family protein [Kineosporia sp. A_224]|uniref:SdpI family protein n=1 Tax=Kineosporia sp. A_224 TaxID=1962180 RepID=UPI000B4B9EF8|nr:SdpI family protein [Kineosporia sp. A_224]